MPSSTRFTARRDGANGAKIKDNRTGRYVAIFPEDPELPDMAMRFAQAACDRFNDLHSRHKEKLRKMGFNSP